MEVKDGGVIIDYHSSDFFPKRWFDVIVVLRCENTQILYDRLVNRGYTAKKLRDNVEYEIFGIAAEEALNSYDADCIYHLQNETLDQLTNNIRLLTNVVIKFEKK